MFQKQPQGQVYPPPQQCASPVEEDITMEQQPVNTYAPGEVVPGNSKKKLYGKPDRRVSVARERHAIQSFILMSVV